MSGVSFEGNLKKKVLELDCNDHCKTSCEYYRQLIFLYFKRVDFMVCKYYLKENIKR